jgi:Na+-translocating ferredoxin:NAD+ oxidoreductase subunit C
MKTKRFSLDAEPGAEVVVCPEPEQVVVPLDGHSTKTVKKKEEVAAGSTVAGHPAKSAGDAHSPINGVVADVKEWGVTINAQPVEATFVPGVSSGLKGDELRARLKELGISTDKFTKANTLVVNGLNTEPGTRLASYLGAHQADLVARGLDAVRTLTGGLSSILVRSQRDRFTIQGTTTVQVPAMYPNSMHPLVLKAATGKELPKGVVCVDIHVLHRIGKALETGMPVTEILVSVGSTIVQAKVGQKVSEVLQAAGVSVQEYDSVISGGPLRGVAISTLDKGLAKDNHVLTIVHRDPDARDQGSTACINCGECVAHCPARLRPNMIGRFSEFLIYDKTREYGIDHCFECGLCTYWCTSRRPILQYIRLAKQELASRDAQLESCALNE